MSRPEALSHAPATVAGRADTWIRRTAGVTVAGLACIAGALSYSHMRQLAEAHGNTGWHAHTLPLSVDGVEIVASLVLLADRRTGRRSGWLPWTALLIGTAASLAANIATALPGTISRIITGWPAVALLLAVKLLSGMLKHRDGDRPGPAVPGTGTGDDTGTVPAAPAGDANRAARDSVPPVSASRAPEPGQPHTPMSARTQAVAGTGTGTGTASAGQSQRGDGTGTVPGIAVLLAAARTARDDLTRDGQHVTRDAIATRLRRAGYPVRNSRLTPVMHALRNDTAA